MKSIENKVTDINQTDENGKAIGKATYADLIIICIRQGKQGGFDYSDITNRSEISKAVEAAKAKTGEPETLTIDLENSYFDYLKKTITEMRWGFWHDDIIKFRDEILAIK